MMTLMDAMQWLGCASGMAGSVLLALRNKWSGWGFVVYLFSNSCWMVFGLLSHAPGLVAMQVVFMVTSFLGVWRWLIAPRKASQALCV